MMSSAEPLTTDQFPLLADATAQVLSGVESNQLLRELDIQSEDHVAAVIDRIADQCLSPGPPDSNWAGRDETIFWAIEKLKLSSELAAEVVRGAVTRLWAEDVPKDSRVQQRLALSRLCVLRRKIQEAIFAERFEERHQFIEDPNGTLGDNGRVRMIKVPWRTKTVKGPHSDMISRALMVEGMIADIMGARAVQGAETAEMTLERIVRDGNTTVSLKKTQKMLGEANLSPAAVEDLIRSIGRETKAVESKEIGS